MAWVLKRSLGKPGLPPGTVVHVGRERAEPVRVTVIRYDEAEVHEATAATHNTAAATPATIRPFLPILSPPIVGNAHSWVPLGEAPVSG